MTIFSVVFSMLSPTPTSLNSHNKCNTPYGRPYIASGVSKS